MAGHVKNFQSVNRGKRSLVLDLHRAETREVVERLIPKFDVVLVNYRPGVTQRIGIDYKTLSKVRRDLIYAQNSGFDPAGPYAAKVASDMVAQAYVGGVWR